MLGAIIGDIVGSVYEFSSDKTKDFPLFHEGSRLTDDSFMTVAVACACMKSDLSDEEDFKSWTVHYMRKIGRAFPDAGYGYNFARWLNSDVMGPYNSCGNGSAMRVSPVAYVAKTLDEAEKLAKWSAEVSHDHPEGIKGAQAVAAAVFLARKGNGKEAIKAYVEKNFYSLNFTLDEIRPSYKFDVTCQGSIPQALQCFFEAESYEDALRNAVSLGGDGDTQAAMAGAVAEAYFGIPTEILDRGLARIEATDKNYFKVAYPAIYQFN